jgi:hypothetical protein
MWNVMELHDDTRSHGSTSTADDPDLRDDRATPASERWWFGAIVALDILAIVAFVAWVVIPRLT